MHQMETAPYTFGGPPEGGCCFGEDMRKENRFQRDSCMNMFKEHLQRYVVIRRGYPILLRPYLKLYFFLNESVKW